MISEDKDKYILELSDVGANRGPVPILHNINLCIKRGEIVVLLGPNGAGKTTLMHTIAGLLPVVTGRIIFDGQLISGLHTEVIVRSGLALVPEGKLLFPVMSVIDNLMLATYHRRGAGAKEKARKDLETVFSLFPTLKKRKKQIAETLSGGEQEMVAIARGLMSNPKLLLLDEPSLGLSPLLVKEVVDTLSQLKTALGISILLAEQNVAAALRIADRGYVLGKGHVVSQGSADELRASDEIRHAYLGKTGYRSGT